MPLEERVELSIDDALAGISTIESALTSAAQAFKVDLADALNLLTSVAIDSVDAQAVTTSIDEAVTAADTSPEITADATEVTSSIDAAIGAADTEPTITADASDVTGAIDDAVAAADTEVPLTVDPSEADAAVGGFTDRLASRLNRFASGNPISKMLTEIKVLAPAAGQAIESALGPVGLLIAAVGALGFVAFEGVHKFVDLAGEVRRFKNITGETSEEASRFVVALEELGASPDAVGNGLARMGRQIEDGTSKLASLGVEIARTKDGNVDVTETFLNVADAVQKSGGGAKASEIAFAAFGRQGINLLPILAAGRDRLIEFKKVADERGEVFTDRDLRQARDYGVALRSMKGSVDAVEIALGRALVPTLTTVFDAIAKGVDGAHRLGGEFAGLASHVGGLGNIIDSTVPGIGFMREGLHLLGGSSESASQKQQQLADAENETKAKIQSANQAIQEQTKLLEDLLNVELDLIDATLGLQGAEDTYNRSIDSVHKAQTAYNEAVRQFGVNSGQAHDALLDLNEATHGQEAALVGLAKAQAQQVEDQRKANGEIIDAQTHNDIYKQTLINVANTVTGPMHDALLALAGDLKTADENAQIQATMSVDNAITDGQRLVNFINSIPKNVDVDFALQSRARVSRTPVPSMAGGQREAGTTLLVGEAGRELVDLLPGGGAVVHDNPSTEQALGGGRPISVVVNEVASDPRATAFAVGAILNEQATR